LTVPRITLSPGPQVFPVGIDDLDGDAVLLQNGSDVEKPQGRAYGPRALVVRDAAVRLHEHDQITHLTSRLPSARHVDLFPRHLIMFPDKSESADPLPAPEREDGRPVPGLPRLGCIGRVDMIK